MNVDTTGRPLVSSLELLTRYTHVLWQCAHQQGVKSRPGAVLPQRSSKAVALVDGDNEVFFCLSFIQYIIHLPSLLGRSSLRLTSVSGCQAIDLEDDNNDSLESICLCILCHHSTFHHLKDLDSRSISYYGNIIPSPSIDFLQHVLWDMALP